MNLRSLYHTLSLAAALAGSTLGVKAQLTIGTASQNGTYINQTNSAQIHGETFTAPTGATALTALVSEFGVIGNGGPDTITASIFEWNRATSELGALVGTSTAAITSSTPLDYEFDFTGANVTAGDLYAFFYTGGTNQDDYYYGANSSHTGGYLYSGATGVLAPGASYTSFTSYDINYQATFSAGAITPVPETQNLMIGGLVLCAGLGVYFSRRQQAGLPVA